MYQRNQNLKSVLYRLHLHYQTYSNRFDGKDIISIEKLLYYFIDFPEYQNPFKNIRSITAVNRRIIGNFAHCLEILEQEHFLTWEYCNGKKEELTDYDRVNMDKYSLWEKKYITFSLSSDEAKTNDMGDLL